MDNLILNTTLLADISCTDLLKFIASIISRLNDLGIHQELLFVDWTLIHTLRIMVLIDCIETESDRLVKIINVLKDFTMFLIRVN
jgi:hypothetical protein